MKTHERRAGAAKVVFLSTVRGLLSEGPQVAAVIAEQAPDCIVISAGTRELEEIEEVLMEKGKLPGKEGNRVAGSTVSHGTTGLPAVRLKRDEDESDYEDFGLFLSTSDLVFMRQLSRWGAVEMPPPSFQEAVRVGHERGVAVVAGDFDDEGYTDVFLKNVTYFSLARQGRRLRKLGKRRFKVETPEAFAAAWDEAVTKVKGYAQVERARESQIARSVRRAATDHQCVLALVELERLDGVLEAFDTGLRAPETPPAAPAATAALAEGSP